MPSRTNRTKNFLLVLCAWAAVLLSVVSAPVASVAAEVGHVRVATVAPVDAAISAPEHDYVMHDSAKVEEERDPSEDAEGPVSNEDLLEVTLTTASVAPRPVILLHELADASPPPGARSHIESVAPSRGPPLA